MLHHLLTYYRENTFAFSNWYVYKLKPGERVPIVFPSAELLPLAAATPGRKVQVHVLHRANVG